MYKNVENTSKGFENFYKQKSKNPFKLKLKKMSNVSTENYAKPFIFKNKHTIKSFFFIFSGLSK